MASLEKFKLQSATWDSDKEPNRFVQFMYLISAIIRSIAHGNHLEDWLDRKLGRARHQGMTTPSFLSDDPEFQQPDGAAGEDEDGAYRGMRLLPCRVHPRSLGAICGVTNWLHKFSKINYKAHADKLR